MTTDAPTPTCQNCDHYRHKAEKRGGILKSIQRCNLAGRYVNPSMPGCPLHEYAPPYRSKGAKNATQQTRYPET
jgi:hypothetical protein